MMITVVLLGVVAGIGSVIAALIAGFPIWVLALAYPLGGLVAVAGLLTAMFFLMPPADQQDPAFAGAAKAN